MTKEEAIKQIDDLKQYLNQSTAWYLNDKHKTALDMAISALKERPKELTLSEVETYANEHNYVLWTEEMSEKALALIKADRDRPKGEWDINCQGIVFCSKCKKVINHNYDIDYIESHFNFCPNCGSDMRGKAE